MARIIDPPKGHFSKLPTPLTAGELRVVELFDANLPPEWEIYVQPHLNGLRPDIVLLHPRVGIAVFEIKDWDLEALHYYSESAKNGGRTLVARDRDRHTFRVRDNPVDKIQLYKKEIFDLYCPRLNSAAGSAVITAGIIFTCATRSEIERVFGPFRECHEGMRVFPRYYPIAGREDVASANLDRIFPEWRRASSWYMNQDIADDLRGWLKEPYSSQEQRTPLELDARQRDLATSRTETGYRRIKGPAGSGKSVILAARAATLAAEGKRILVVSFNITLLNYLRDLSVRHVAARNVIRNQIDFLNFHLWCKRVCVDSGNKNSYDELWEGSQQATQAEKETILNVRLPTLVQQLYRESADQELMPRYDAILVDEGQDFYPSWWQTLRLALKVGGEMILVADKTQNIYSTAAAWTEEAMASAGFRGPWAELKISYRLPPNVVPLVSRFAKDFMTGEEVDIPQLEERGQQGEFAELFPVDLRWVHVPEPSGGLDACIAELRRMMIRLRADTSMSDITVLSGTKSGRGLAEYLESKKVNLLHTFDEDGQDSRRQKRAFFQGAANVKATTLHSFKGWEARHLVLFVESAERAEDRALIYTALTRIKRHVSGSALTVVSCCPELMLYGQSWPDFVDSRSAQA
jgi:hypothetical protein